MFKNFFFFARKRFYEDIDDDDSLGRESQQALENSDYNAFSDEFAEMLGLSRVGVTTHISAGDGSDAQRNQIRNRMLAKVGGKLPRRLPSQHDNERQTELRAREEEEKGLDWSSGITKTTVISYE
jgi:lysozyme family protein